MATYTLESAWDTTPTSSSVFEFYDPDDHYLVGNSIDPIKKYDLTNFDDLEGGAPKGNIFAIYKDRLMVAGDPNFPHRIWYSHIRNGEGWSLDTDWLEVRPEDGGKLNFLGIQNDELIIGKDNGKLYGWRIFEDGDPTNSRLRIIEDDKGPLNKNAGVTLEDILYYLDRNLVGAVPGETKGGLSFIIKEVIDGIQDYDNVSLGANDGLVYLYLGDITIELGDTVSLTNAVLVLDTVNAAYYLRDQTDARVFSKFIDNSGEEQLYFGDSQGRVFKIGEGNVAGSSPIHMQVRTKPYFRDFGKQMTVRKVGILMDDPDGTHVSYRTDLNQKFMNSVGTVLKEPIQWFPINATGELFQMEFTHSGTKARPRLNGFIIRYEEGGERV